MPKFDPVTVQAVVANDPFVVQVDTAAPPLDVQMSIASQLNRGPCK
jgi:hypothetical protein